MQNLEPLTFRVPQLAQRTALTLSPFCVAAVAVGMLLRLGLTLARRVPRRASAYMVMSLTFLAVGVMKWPLVPVVAVVAPISIALAWPRRPRGSANA